MPNYDFKCDTCGSIVEKYFGFTEEQVLHCDTCNTEMKKVIQSTPIQFKTDGFYSTGG